MSNTLRISNAYDSDSDSDFDNPLNGETKKQEPEYDEDCPWRPAVDQSSGKTYYYHIHTRETQWNKPSDMASREEKEALAAKERRQKDFFAAMEANIMASIAQGFKAPEKKNLLDKEFENKPISDDPLAISNVSQSSRRQLSPTRARLTRGSSNSSQRSQRSMGRDRSRPNLIRTISSMDSAFLSDLIQRVPSSRQVINPGGGGGGGGGGGRGFGGPRQQSSNRSIGGGRGGGLGFGSSHHSSRTGARLQRNLPSRQLVAPKKKDNNDGGGGVGGDDLDDLPPLTVVTTPDLRTGLTREKSIGLDALMGGDSEGSPQLGLTRGESMTLAELQQPSFHGNRGGPLGLTRGESMTLGELQQPSFRGGPLGLTRGESMTLAELQQPSFNGNLAAMGGSDFFNQSTGSRLTTSQNSLPEGSDHSLGQGFVGGSFNRSSMPSLNNNCSFNSFDSSDNSFGALNNSATGMSVSGSLHPVRESIDESDGNNPRSSLSVNRVVFEDENEDDDDTKDGEASFNLGSPQLSEGRTTSNWLDALPQDDGANNEELVGYGDNAKRFSDAGFTSFFDESMANFDLTDKETQALQKLAAISEQMTKVAEGEEEESDDTDDEDESSSESDDTNQQEFPMFFSSEDEAVTEDEEPSSDDNGFNVVKPSFPPTFKTPTISKKSQTSSTTKSPISLPGNPPRQSPALPGNPPRQGLPRNPPRNKAPAKRTLGPKNTRVARAQRNLSINDDDGTNDDKTAAPAPAPASSAVSNLPVNNLALAAATLTIDNARSHQTTNHVNEGREQRRHSAAMAMEWSPPKGSDGRPALEKAAASASTMHTANAARRLSMFKLKNIDRSKLRSISGKGGLAEALSSTDDDLKDPKPGPEIKRSSTTDPNAMKGADDAANRPNLMRRNTCGTLYVGTTMSAPDKDATIKCVCGVFRAHILQSERDEEGMEGSPKYRIFNDLESQQGTNRRFDKNRRTAAASPVPSLEQITTFYRDVFQRAQMEYDCIIISLIYVERLVKTTRGALRPRSCNWRSILFSCMVLASKVWDDLSMWNADFSATCPNGVRFPLKRINELEVEILSALSYKVKVPASEYAKYYFLLRSMLIKSGLVGDNVDTTTPLDVEGARRLQQVSKQFQSGIGQTRRQMRKAKSMRSKSMGQSERNIIMTGAREPKAKNRKVNLEHVVKM